MYEVIYMKADYEPWWLFEDWKEKIQTRKVFTCKAEAKQYMDTVTMQFSGQFDHHEVRKECFFAFWSDEEKVYCEGCDDELQIFHGIISFVNGEPAPIILKNNSNI
ncbi:DUF1033 family protein [Sporosarcina sp. OR05]|uniref:DUF1033 family protein n=1 Tax=Sporosarcina sp. OR05 TaxID=2969819 RepID=UPI00352B398F